MKLVTHEGAMTLAASLDDPIYKDGLLASLERMDYTTALMVCGEAILNTLKRETDLSVEELKIRMRSCRDLEKLEKMISTLARQARAAARERKALLRGRSAPAIWPPLPDGNPAGGLRPEPNV